MQIIAETLSVTLKNARKRSEFTVEALAEKIGVTERYLYRIENGGQIPSVQVLYRLIRELSISPEAIFYPEKETKQSEIDTLVHMMVQCDERSLSIIRATIEAALDSQEQ